MNNQQETKLTKKIWLKVGSSETIRRAPYLKDEDIVHPKLKNFGNI